MNSAKEITLEQWMASFRNGKIMRGGVADAAANNGAAHGAASPDRTRDATDGRDDGATADMWEVVRLAAA